MNEPTTTIIGNATADCELRFAPSGVAVASFTVAQTPRSMNRQTNQWEDGETIFMRVTTFKDAAENAAESVKKGTRVIVTGKLQMERWEKDGQKHERMAMIADEIGVSTRFATVTAQRAERASAGAAAAGGDPWATGATAPAAAPWGAPAGPPPAWGQPQHTGGAAPGYVPPQGPPQGYPQPAPGGWGPPPGTDEPPF